MQAIAVAGACSVVRRGVTRVLSNSNKVRLWRPSPIGCAHQRGRDARGPETEMLMIMIMNVNLYSAKHYGADAVVRTELSLNAVGSMQHR